MGPVKGRYIHYEKAGDQFVGRCVTGISSLTPEFACSPCYFDYTCALPGTRTRIDDIIDENLVKKENVPATMFVSL